MRAIDVPAPTIPMSAAATDRRSVNKGDRRALLDPESRAWLIQLHGERPIRDAAIARLHTLLVQEARHEVRRRTAALPHPSGRDLDDLAVQAADDALVALLAKLDDFRGDARFTTWATRFAALEVPGKIRRRLGHSRETPVDSERWPIEAAGSRDPEQLAEVAEIARSVGRLIADALTTHQREVLLAMAIDEVPARQLADRLDSTPGALYKTLHDARLKLRQGLAERELVTAAAGRTPPGSRGSTRTSAIPAPRG